MEEFLEVMEEVPEVMKVKEEVMEEFLAAVAQTEQQPFLLLKQQHSLLQWALTLKQFVKEQQ